MCYFSTLLEPQGWWKSTCSDKVSGIFHSESLNPEIPNPNNKGKRTLVNSRRGWAGAATVGIGLKDTLTL